MLTIGVVISYGQPTLIFRLSHIQRIVLETSWVADK